MAYPMYSNIKDKNTGKRLIYEEMVAKHVIAATNNIAIEDITESDKPDLIIGNMGIEVVSAVHGEFKHLMALLAKQNHHGENNTEKIEECAKKISAKVTPYGIVHKSVYIIDGVTKVQSTPYITILSAYKQKLEKLNNGGYQKKSEYRLFVYSEDCIDGKWICGEIGRELSKLSEGAPIQYTHVYVYGCNGVIDFDLQAKTFTIIHVDCNALATNAWNEIESRMSLTNLIQRYCPNGVEYKSLKTVVTPHRGKGLSKSDKNTGDTNIILYGELYTTYGNYITEIFSKCSENVAKKATLISQGDLVLPLSSTTKEAQIGKASVIKISTPIYLGGDAVALTPSTGVNSDYLMYVINGCAFEYQKMKCVRGTTIQHLNPNMVYDIEIPVPPLPVQKEIVRILDKFTELEQELEQELELRKKQYEYYRDKMLSLSDYDREVKIVPLRDVLKEQIHTGLNPRKFFQVNTDDATNYYVTIREMVDGRIVFNDRTDRINDNAMQLCQNRSKLEDGCLLFSGTGTIGVVVLVNKKPDNWNIKEGVYVIKPNQDIVLSGFMKYALQSRQFVKAYSSKIVGGTVKSIPMKELMDVEIAYPTDLNYQKELIEKLDKFSILTKDISEGLPAEIEARQKQYEYYRDKLLNFKRLEGV